MKNLIKTIFSSRFGFLSIFILALIQISCLGPEGPRGRDGLNGQDGLLYTRSAIFDSNPTSWSGDANGYSTTLNMPEITNDIFNNGAVLVYRLREDLTPKSFNLLPYTYVDNNTTSYMDFDAYIGKVVINFRDITNGQNTTQAPTQLMSFKVVVVTGMAYAELQQNVNLKDFKATMRFLGKDIGKIN